MTIFPAYRMGNPEDGKNTPEIFSLGLTKVVTTVLRIFKQVFTRIM